MAKFEVTETYTPNDLGQDRNRLTIEFFCDSDDEAAIMQQALRACDHEEYADEGLTLDEGVCNEATIATDSGEYHYKVERLSDEAFVPYSNEAIVKWAEQQVAANPTYKDEVWNETKGQRVAVTVPNTVERELGLVVHTMAVEDLSDYKRNELWELVADLYWDGTKGYKWMSREELLKELNDAIEQRYEETPALSNVVPSEE